MKHTLAFALLLLTGTTLLAAPPPPPPPPGPPPEFAEVLALTDAQKAQAEQLHRALRERIEAAHEAFRQSFVAMLTPEQRAKFEVLEEVRKLRERRSSAPPPTR